MSSSKPVDVDFLEYWSRDDDEAIVFEDDICDNDEDVCLVCYITYIMPVIVPVMFLGFQGFLNHNKSSVMLPRSMAFSIFNSNSASARIHPVAVVDEDVQSVVIAGLVERNE
ncbi:hypothetical protein HanPI659440_Chr14g0568481 [Helianthus annuus]|nr:hypothetical protein HanPI659440_Chr14g0568481 [Helianthus annuus]